MFYHYSKGFRQFSPQKGLLMRMLGVGQRKVWLDPTKMDEIAKVKTRKEMWDLLQQGVVRRKFSRRGTHQTRTGPFLFIKDTTQDTNVQTPLQLAIEKALAKDKLRQEKEEEIKKVIAAKEVEKKKLIANKRVQIAAKVKATKTKPVESSQ